MKQFLKHAIFLLLTAFSLSVKATDYYFVGAATDLAVNPRCWNTSSTGTVGGAGCINSTFNATTMKNLVDSFGSLRHTWDFNNRTGINCVGATFTTNTKFYNRSGSNPITLYLTRVTTSTAPSTMANMTFSGNPTFNSTRHSFNLKDPGTTTATTVFYTQSVGTQYIYPSQYYTLQLTGDAKTISTGNTVQINNSINLSVRINIEGTLTLSSGISIGGSFSIGSWALQSTGTITDNRAAISRVFNHPFYCVKSTLPAATYKTLLIYASCVPLGDVTVTNALEIGDGNGDYEFDLNGKSLTLKDATLTCNQFIPNIGSPTTKSRIKATTGKIIIQNAGGQFSVVKDHYGTGKGLHDTGSIYHLQVDCNNQSILSNPRFIDSTITINNITLSNGSLDIEDCVVIVTDSLKTKNDVGTIATLNNSNLGNPTHINMKKSTARLIINNTTSSTLSTFDIDPTLFNDQTIAGLYVNFATSNPYPLGTAILLGDLTVNNSLDLSSTSGNYLKINDFTLTTNGTISSVSSGTKLIGSSASNLICGAKGTVYFDQTSNSNRTLKDLTVNNDSTLTLGNWLFITAGANYGKVKVENGASSRSKLKTGNFLILQADADGYAQVDETSGTIEDKIHVQTYFDGTNGRRYRFLAPQVTDGNVYSLRDSGSLVGVSGIKELTNNWGIQITGGSATSTTDTGFDISTTKNPSAFEFVESNAGSTGLGTGNDAGWKPLHSGKQTLDNGKGYRILIRGDRTIELTGTSGKAADTINTTTQITGNYVGASKTITLSNTTSAGANKGINFIGNPYPAAIDWDTVYSNNSTTGLDQTYVIFDNTSGSYVSYNAVSGASNGGGNLISSGQGFLVYTNTNNANIVINESCKDASGLGDRFFKKIRTNHLVIRMEKDARNFDRSVLYFLPGSTSTYDKYDAGHIKNATVNLASVDAQNNYYAINCLDTLGTSKSVPLTFDGTATGTYTISFEDCGTFPNHDIYLIDEFTKTSTKMDDWTKYTFSITSDPFSSKNGRLSVQFGPKEITSSKSLMKTQSIQISPNPVTDKINLSLKEGVNYQYQITNIDGKIIKSGNLNKNSNSISANTLSNGIYFITLNSDTETQTIKFIK